MLRLSLDLITFPLYPRIILETRLRVLTFKVMMWPTKLTSPTCMSSLWRIWQNQVTKWNFEVHLHFTSISTWRIRGRGEVNFSVLTRGFRCDVCLFLFFLLTPWNDKGISFSGGDTNFYLFLQIKTLFTWSGGPRSSAVSFFCFVSPRAWKQKKPTPLNREPPRHVNRP